MLANKDDPQLDQGVRPRSGATVRFAYRFVTPDSCPRRRPTSFRPLQTPIEDHRASLLAAYEGGFDEFPPCMGHATMAAKLGDLDIVLAGSAAR